MKTKAKRLSVALYVLIAPELKDLISRASAGLDLTMNEWIAIIAADALGRPDLAEIPRNRRGRPRKVPAPQRA